LNKNYHVIKPDSFEPANHWYPKALNSTIHPLVSFFLNLSHERIIERYCHLHPKVNREVLGDILISDPKYFRWAGADLINVTTENGRREMVVIENNSCPSGQKSMPLMEEYQEYGGYRKLIEHTFIPLIRKSRQIIEDGALAVLYDKNHMEASGYAATIADIMDEPVYYIYFPEDGYQDYLKFTEDGILQLKLEDGTWINFRAAFRYVTQKPWSRIPIVSKTLILNPIIACVAGGRNKMVAAKAYESYNEELKPAGLSINLPQTIWDVKKEEVPHWIAQLGGHAVIKVPYSNAGQGVYTIVSPEELEAFMAIDFYYDRFIVQSLIGNYNWSSSSQKGKYYHVGTIPTAKGHTFVADIRMMVSCSNKGILPICVYSRRAKDPLLNHLAEGTNSWDMLGTNLSIKNDDGSWGSDTNRLMLMDRRDFNKVGVGLDDLIEAYIQAVLSMVAIDKMAQSLMNSKGKFRSKLFKSLNDDERLINEFYSYS
jgi:hypothetical protein